MCEPIPVDVLRGILTRMGKVITDPSKEECVKMIENLTITYSLVNELQQAGQANQIRTL
jgi:hypothetical protein